VWHPWLPRGKHHLNPNKKNLCVFAALMSSQVHPIFSHVWCSYELEFLAIPSAAEIAFADHHHGEWPWTDALDHSFMVVAGNLA